MRLERWLSCQLKRSSILAFFQKLSPCLVGVEAWPPHCGIGGDANALGNVAGPVLGTHCPSP
jgi:hypothetical protein